MLHQIGLWTDLWDILLTIERPSSLWVVLPMAGGPQMKKKKLDEQQALRTKLVSNILPWLLLQFLSPSSYFEFLPLLLLMDCELRY